MTQSRRNENKNFTRIIPDDNDEGYILEGDLEYHRHLHNSHTGYPLAPDKRLGSKDKLSQYCKNFQNQVSIAPTRVEKLLTTLEDKEKYVMLYRNLKLFLELGLKLKNVHKVSNKVLQTKSMTCRIYNI